MTNLITDTSEIAEGQWNPDEEPGEVEVAMAATREAESKPIEFHISMQSRTMKVMEELIIEAAARQMLGNFRDSDLAKQIQDRAIALISDKINKALEPVSADILNQPMINNTFAPKTGEPMTMKEFIGLCGRGFLSQHVDSAGNPTESSHWNRSERRVDIIVRKLIDASFKKEVEAQTSALLTEVRNEMKAHLAVYLEKEKARLREGLAYEVKETKR